MINEAHDAERWEKAARVAQAKEMRVVYSALKAEDRILKAEHRRLKRKLFFIKCRRFTRYLFIHKPSMLLMKCRILRLNAMLLLIDGALFLNKLYDKFSAHKRSDAIGTEIPNFDISGKTAD